MSQGKVMLSYIVAARGEVKLTVEHSNPQIEKDASPAALRLLARASHLERYMALGPQQ